MDEIYGNMEVVFLGILNCWFRSPADIAAYFGFTRSELIAFGRDEMDYDLEGCDLARFNIIKEVS